MMPARSTKGRSLADASALAIAFLACLAVIVFSWPGSTGAPDAPSAAGEVRTAELGPPIPAALKTVANR